MLRASIIATLLVSLAATSAEAAPCRDAKGKFVKCGTASAAAKPLPAGITKGKDGKCRNAKGKFAKCPA